VRMCTENLEKENLKDITAATTADTMASSAASTTNVFAVSHDGGNSFEVPNFQVTVPPEQQECNIQVGISFRTQPKISRLREGSKKEEEKRDRE